MTYSPGFTSGSIVMLDMMMPLFSQVEATLGETLRLFTLLGGVEAIKKIEKKKKVSYKAELLNNDTFRYFLIHHVNVSTQYILYPRRKHPEVFFNSYFVFGRKFHSKVR